MRDGRVSSNVLRIVLCAASGAWLLATSAAGAVETLSLESIPISANTGEKPQSKAWFHADTWWVVLPSDSPAGTWVWRLEPDGSFTATLLLSTSSDAKADVLVVGDVTHVLLCDSSGSSCNGPRRRAGLIDPNDEWPSEQPRRDRKRSSLHGACRLRIARPFLAGRPGHFVVGPLVKEMGFRSSQTG